MRNLLITLIFFFSSNVNGIELVSTNVPETSDVDGYRLVKIFGTGFGSVGPQVVLFDDFEKPINGIKGSDGDVVPLSSPLIGSWTSHSHDGRSVRYAVEGGNRAMQAK